MTAETPVSGAGGPGCWAGAGAPALFSWTAAPSIACREATLDADRAAGPAPLARPEAAGAGGAGFEAADTEITFSGTARFGVAFTF